MKNKKKDFEYLTFENNIWTLFKGNPKDPSTTRVDVTMAVKIGIRIGSRNYKDIITEQF